MGTVNRKLLFVDDDPLMLDALKRCLRRHFEAEFTADPVSAIRILRENGPYAVVVSDIRMPEANGIELLAEIKEHCPDVVRIALTASITSESRRGALDRAGVHRFLTKPCSAHNLIEILEQAVQHHHDKKTFSPFEDSDVGLAKELNDAGSSASDIRERPEYNRRRHFSGQA